VAPDAIALAQDLVRAGADASCKAAVEIVKARCKRWRVVEGEGFVWVQASQRAGLVLSGHVDVVPAGQGWTRAPFSGDLADGDVWGRGACDMKGAIAAMLTAAEEVGDGDWALALTLDEETGMGGARNLARAGALEGADLVVVGEPTDLDLGVAHRGVLWVELETKGKAAHGSRPQEGENAITKMVRLLQSVEGFALPEKHALVGGSSLNLGVLRGGEAVNMVPPSCTAQLDLRVPPPASTAGARKGLEAALAKGGIPHGLRILSEHAPFETRPSPLIDRVRHALREAHPGATDIGLPYGTEASVYQAFAPCVVTGPGELARMHALDERVSIAQVRAATRFYRSLLEAWA
jgi:acetylornithine deacetylase/succinyl-diaminopimelate desuccinylase-like protein